MSYRITLHNDESPDIDLPPIPADWKRGKVRRYAIKFAPYHKSVHIAEIDEVTEQYHTTAEIVDGEYFVNYGLDDESVDRNQFVKVLGELDKRAGRDKSDYAGDTPSASPDTHNSFLTHTLISGAIRVSA